MFGSGEKFEVCDGGFTDVEKLEFVEGQFVDGGEEGASDREAFEVAETLCF